MTMLANRLSDKWRDGHRCGHKKKQNPLAGHAARLCLQPSGHLPPSGFCEKKGRLVE